MDIANGAFRVIGDIAGHGGAAAIMGYFLGIHRFESTSIIFLPAGIATSAFLDGLFLYARSEVNRIGLGATSDAFSPWPGFIASLFISSVLFFAVYGLLQRANAQTAIRMQLSDNLE